MKRGFQKHTDLVIWNAYWSKYFVPQSLFTSPDRTPRQNFGYLYWYFRTYFKTGKCCKMTDGIFRTPLSMFQEMNAQHNFPAAAEKTDE